MWQTIKDKILAFLFSIADAAKEGYDVLANGVSALVQKIKSFFA
jgi:hypothetical protein